MAYVSAVDDHGGQPGVGPDIPLLVRADCNPEPGRDWDLCGEGAGVGALNGLVIGQHRCSGTRADECDQQSGRLRNNVSARVHQTGDGELCTGRAAIGCAVDAGAIAVLLIARGQGQPGGMVPEANPAAVRQ